MSLEDNIKSWINYDNQLKKLNDEIKALRNQKNSISSNIINYVKNNELKNSIIKDNISTIKFIDTKYTPPLTYKFLIECLNECINDKNLIDNIIHHMKNKREIKNTLEIKRFLNN